MHGFSSIPNGESARVLHGRPLLDIEGTPSIHYRLREEEAACPRRDHHHLPASNVSVSRIQREQPFYIFYFYFCFHVSDLPLLDPIRWHRCQALSLQGVNLVWMMSIGCARLGGFASCVWKGVDVADKGSDRSVQINSCCGTVDSISLWSVQRSVSVVRMSRLLVISCVHKLGSPSPAPECLIGKTGW
jgi:hypothetical protein